MGDAGRENAEENGGTRSSPDPAPVLGLRENLAQFSLLVLINAFVGGMVGLERTVLPLIAEQEFGLVSRSAILSFIVGFGVVKAFTNLAAGRFSDRVGRKWMITGGMWIQAAGIVLVAATGGFRPWLYGTILLGVGTAMVYPTLLAAIGDVAHPSWRASAVGVYRLWRYAGYAFGALLAGAISDLLGIPQAIAAIGASTFLSGVVVAFRMSETLALREAKGGNG